MFKNFNSKKLTVLLLIISVLLGFVVKRTSFLSENDISGINKVSQPYCDDSDPGGSGHPSNH